MGIERGELVSRLREQAAQLRMGADEPNMINQRALFGALQGIREDAESDELDMHPRDPFARRISMVAEAYQDQLIYAARIEPGAFSQEALDARMDRYPARTARQLGKLGLGGDHMWQARVVATGETAIGRSNSLLYMAWMRRTEGKLSDMRLPEGHTLEEVEGALDVGRRQLRSSLLAREAFRRLVKFRPDTAF